MQRSSGAHREQIAELEAELAAERAALAMERARNASLTQERDLLRASHERLRLELALLKRRIFVAKAERVDSTQLELEFAVKLAELDKLAGLPPREAEDESSDDGDTKRGKKKPTGRRNLRQANLEEERVEILDPLFEQLVEQNKAERIGFEESCKLAWKQGGLRRLVVARAKYKAVDAQGNTQIETTPMPAECFPRSLAAPSLLAKIIVDKYCDGLPLHRIESRFARDGFPIDRGTMCRWMEDAGGTTGATVVVAARKDAFATALCMATDATGVLVQPIPTHEKRHQPCRRGHFFVTIADRDHIFFDYTAKENSRVVSELFRGYSGYIQADAKSVYDVLFHPPKKKPLNSDDEDDAIRYEIACWAHCRRGFWEATVAKSVVAREGLARIGRIYDVDQSWSDKAPAEILRLRQAHLRPHMEASSPGPSSNSISCEINAECCALRSDMPIDSAKRSCACSRTGAWCSTTIDPSWNSDGTSQLDARRGSLSAVTPRHQRRPPLLAHRVLPPSRPRSRALLPRSLPGPALLAPRPPPRARPQVLGRHPRAPRRQRA